MKKFLSYILIIAFLVLLMGCDSLKNEKSIKQYVLDKYGIEVDVVSKVVSKDTQNLEGYQKHIKYEMKEKNRDLMFYCESYYVPVIGWHETTTDDYYDKLAEYSTSEIERISQKYNVEFKMGGFIPKFVNGLNVNVKAGEEVDYLKVEEALNELMKIYDLKKLDNVFQNINLSINNKKTDIYYSYVYAGDSVVSYTKGNAQKKDPEIFNQEN